jgi:hypothetical protein
MDPTVTYFTTFHRIGEKMKGLSGGYLFADFSIAGLRKFLTEVT